MLIYEELQQGYSLTGPGRTMTETDLTMASMISGDWHPVHADIEYAKSTTAGVRLVHGGYITMLMLGASARLVVFEGDVILLGLSEWTFKAPVCVGDTLHLVLTLESKRLTSDGRKAVLVFVQRLMNQKADCVVEGKSSHMVYLGSQAQETISHM